jgi:putative DNA primase/helicase
MASEVDPLAAVAAAVDAAAKQRHGANKKRANGRAQPETDDQILCTDFGNVDRILAQHGRDLRYTPGLGWLAWAGTHWSTDDAQVTRAAQEALRGIFDEIKDAPDHLKKPLFSWALKSCSTRAVRDALTLVKHAERVCCDDKTFDQDHWLLNVKNGTLDLRSGELREHRRDDYITKKILVDFDPAAPAAGWDAFLDRVTGGDEDLQAYLQRIAGYCLTGSIEEQKLFFLYGSGSNGKSVFLEVLRALLGSYARSLDFNSLVVAQNPKIPNDMAALRGVRLAVSSEVEDGQRLAESRVKDITGGDTISVRFLHKEFFDLKPEFKLAIRGNSKPKVRGRDEGIWRRIDLVPFTQTISGNEVNKHLFFELCKELPGVLAWAVRGCLDWQENGLQQPESVLGATREYRRECNSLAAFIEECCALDPAYEIGATALRNAYIAWADERGEFVPSAKKLADWMAADGFLRRRSKAGAVYIGVRLGDG